MKKLSIFVAALVLTLGLAQCKKEQPNAQNVEGETVHITVKVNNNGSRADVNTVTGKITFNDNDKLYVGYKNICVGYLEYNSNTNNFSGAITLSETGHLLHFYYLGGGNATQVGETQQYTVDISDQTSNYPVISYGTSNVAYTGASSYTTTLLNKCALVKFTISKGTSEAVKVGGMMTKATIDFANPGVFTPSTEGEITLHAGATDTEKWAILLPQDAVENAPVAIGNSVGYSVDVPAIVDNDFAISTISSPPTSITRDNTNVFNASNQSVVISKWNRSATFEGITITMNGDGAGSSFKPYDKLAKIALLTVYGNDGDSFTFEAPLGKQFTKIEIIDNGYITFTAYGDWTKPADNKIEWNGTAANAVTLGGNALTTTNGLNSIVFTLVDE